MGRRFKQYLFSEKSIIETFSTDFEIRPRRVLDGFPVGTKIIKAEYDPERQNVILTVESRDFPEVEPGSTIPLETICLQGFSTTTESA